MKTFEEKWTAWLDGELRGKELAEFEASLPDRAAAEAEKLETQKLGGLLKQQLRAPAMGNEEFFNHQLRERIEAEDAKGSTGRSEPTTTFLVVDWASRLVRCDSARIVCRLHIFCDAQPGTGGSIAISFTDFECAGGSWP